MTETLATRKPLTGYHLKLIALVTMFIDHIGAVFFPQLNILRAIGRISFPLYVFLAAEGCRYTHDRTRYALRLGLFALISEIPYDLALYPDYFRQDGLGPNFFLHNNVFYTLFLGVAAIQIFESVRRHSRKVQLASVGSVVAFFALLLVVDTHTSLEGAYWYVWVCGPLYIVAFLLLCRRWERRGEAPAKSGTLSNILGLLPLIVLLLVTDTFMGSYDTFGVAAIFLVYLGRDAKWRSLILALLMLYYYGLRWVSSTAGPAYVLPRLFFALLAAALTAFAYNGQRGKPTKWAFYAAYPVHLGILAALRAVLGV